MTCVQLIYTTTTTTTTWRVDDTSKRRSQLMAGDDDEMIRTRSLNAAPKTTEQHLTARGDKTPLEVLRC